MREYKMGRGEYLDERVPDFEATIEEYFGPVTGTESYGDDELYVVDDPDNPVFDQVVAGSVTFPRKKNKVAVEFVERPAEDVIAEGNADAAQAALEAKNEFLFETTGRDAEARRKSLKREVEDDDSPDVS